MVFPFAFLGRWVGDGALSGWMDSVFFESKQLVRLSKFPLSDFCPGFLGISPAGQETVDANLQKLTQLVNKESNLIEKVKFTSVVTLY